MLIECWLLSAMVILEAFIQLKCQGTNFQCLPCETLTISQPFNHQMLKREKHTLQIVYKLAKSHSDRRRKSIRNKIANLFPNIVHKIAIKWMIHRWCIYPFNWRLHQIQIKIWIWYRIHGILSSNSRKPWKSNIDP